MMDAETARKLSMKGKETLLQKMLENTEQELFGRTGKGDHVLCMVYPRPIRKAVIKELRSKGFKVFTYWCCWTITSIRW